MEQADRFNKNKLRFDLINPIAQEGMVRVLTHGASKYSPQNWLKGQEWSTCIASLKRHLNAFEMGEDWDIESGQLHVDHIQCNAHFLSAYYKIAPEFDDRLKTTPKKIGLDIDEVLADWVTYWTDYHGQPIPQSWYFDRDIKQKFLDLHTNREFWLNMPCRTLPQDIPFEPYCYITARSIPLELTIEWLDKMGYPARPVYCVGHGESKIEVAKKSGITIFVDDSYENFIELNKAGIFTYLFDRPHNSRYNVGYKRIYSLMELKHFA